MFKHLVFEKDIELDVHMTKSFLGTKAGGVDFSENIYGPNPALKEIDVSDNEELTKFIQNEYKVREIELNVALEKFQSNWDLVEEKFVKLTENIFHSHSFPDGEYKGYLSINNCNPRFLEDKSFMIFYKDDYSNQTAAHELMHFMFYDYSLMNFPELFQNENPNSGNYWILAELFNNVLLSEQEYLEVLGNRKDLPYPDHEQYYNSFLDLWNEDKDVKKFIPKAFHYLENGN